MKLKVKIFVDLRDTFVNKLALFIGIATFIGIFTYSIWDARRQLINPKKNNGSHYNYRTYGNYGDYSDSGCDCGGSYDSGDGGGCC